MGKCRIKAASASEAASALESIRQACAAPLKKWQAAEANYRSRLLLLKEGTVADILSFCEFKSAKKQQAVEDEKTLLR